MIENEVRRERYGNSASGLSVQLREYQRIFTTSVLLRRLLLGVSINMLGQFSGINGGLLLFGSIGDLKLTVSHPVLCANNLPRNWHDRGDH